MAGPASVDTWKAMLTAVLLMLTAWLMYLPSVKYGWVDYDDVRILRDHPELYGQPVSASLKAIFVTSFPREEPLLMRDVSWVVDGMLFGFGNPLGYHLGNVLLHGVMTALLYVFLLMTTRRHVFALVTTLAHLSLAIHVEPVVWIMGRKDILSAIFMLGALCLQTRRLETGLTTASKLAWHSLVVLCSVLGLLSKISVLSFPLVLVIHALCLPFLRGEKPPGNALRIRDVIREACYALPLFVICGGVFLWYRHTLDQMGIFDRGYTAAGWDHVWNLVVLNPSALRVYLQQLFLPWNLSVLYDWPSVQGAYPVTQISGAFVVWGAILGALAACWRWRKDLLFYMAAFLVLMVPYSNLIYAGIWVADRYLYFSSFCLLAMCVSLLTPWWLEADSWRRRAALLVGAVFALTNLAQKFTYQPEWRDGERLWRYHITLPEPNPAAFENLAATYYSHAARHQGTVQMDLDMQKMSVVVEAGLEKFWPDRRRQPDIRSGHLLFLRAIVQEVNGDLDGAWMSLEMSDGVRKDFDATNLNLARLHRKLAARAKDPPSRLKHLNAAVKRLEHYIRIAFDGPPTPPEIRGELAEIKAELARAEKLETSTPSRNPGE